MSTQDDDAAKAQGKRADGEVDPSAGQHPPNIERLDKLHPNALSAGSEQHQPPSEITAAASMTHQSGNATPPTGSKRKLEKASSKRSKKKHPKT